jgi:hypothetical protein
MRLGTNRDWNVEINFAAIHVDRDSQSAANLLCCDIVRVQRLNVVSPGWPRPEFPAITPRRKTRHTESEH